MPQNLKFLPTYNSQIVNKIGGGEQPSHSLAGMLLGWSWTTKKLMKKSQDKADLYLIKSFERYVPLNEPSIGGSYDDQWQLPINRQIVKCTGINVRAINPLFNVVRYSNGEELTCGVNELPSDMKRLGQRIAETYGKVAVVDLSADNKKELLVYFPEENGDVSRYETRASHDFEKELAEICKILKGK
jgi:hypothetical protein